MTCEVCQLKPVGYRIVLYDSGRSQQDIQDGSFLRVLQNGFHWHPFGAHHWKDAQNPTWMTDYTWVNDLSNGPGFCASTGFLYIHNIHHQNQIIWFVHIVRIWSVPASLALEHMGHCWVAHIYPIAGSRCAIAAIPAMDICEQYNSKKTWSQDSQSKLIDINQNHIPKDFPQGMTVSDHFDTMRPPCII